MRKTDREIKLRVVLIDPPAGVVFALKQGVHDIVSPTMATGDDLTFDLTVRVRADGDGSPNLLGSLVHGPRGQRHLGITSGTLAGQPDSCWTRGVKIKLHTITWELIQQLDAIPGSVLEAKIAGKAKDGGPACATVPLLDGGWRLVAKP